MSVELGKVKFLVGVVYRQHTKVNCRTFTEELESQLLSLLPTHDEVLCLGDINIDMSNLNDNDALRFNDMIEGIDIKQLMDKPTRVTPKTSKIIDIILTSNLDLITHVDTLNADAISDHELIYCKLTFIKSTEQPTFKRYRDFGNFDKNKFLSDFVAFPFNNIYRILDVNDKVSFLTNNLINLFDIHAPVKTTTRRSNASPWLTSNTKFLMSLRDKAKGRWKRTRAVTDHNEYKELRNFTARVIRDEKRAYVNFRMCRPGDASSDVWKRLRKIGILKNKPSLPETLSNVNDINDYFISALPPATTSQQLINSYLNDRKDGVNIFEFKLVSQAEVERVFLTMKNTSAGADGVSQFMLTL
nr:uncharacterized protein LOC111420393 [Onthophagus taurus]